MVLKWMIMKPKCVSKCLQNENHIFFAWSEWDHYNFFHLFRCIRSGKSGGIISQDWFHLRDPVWRNGIWNLPREFWGMKQFFWGVKSSFFNEHIFMLLLTHKSFHRHNVNQSLYEKVMTVLPGTPVFWLVSGLVTSPIFHRVYLHNYSESRAELFTRGTLICLLTTIAI